MGPQRPIQFLINWKKKKKNSQSPPHVHKMENVIEFIKLKELRRIFYNFSHRSVVLLQIRIRYTLII